MAEGPRAFHPDRRQFLKIGAWASVLALPLFSGVLPRVSGLSLSLNRGRVRPGGRVDVFGLGRGEGPLVGRIARIAPDRRTFEFLGDVTLQPSAPGQWGGAFVASSQRPDSPHGDSYCLAVVCRVGDELVFSDLLEVISTPLVAGL